MEIHHPDSQVVRADACTCAYPMQEARKQARTEGKMVREETRLRALSTSTLIVSALLYSTRSYKAARVVSVMIAHVFIDSTKSSSSRDAPDWSLPMTLTRPPIPQNLLTNRPCPHMLRHIIRRPRHTNNSHLRVRQTSTIPSRRYLITEHNLRLPDRSHGTFLDPQQRRITRRPHLTIHNP